MKIDPNELNKRLNWTLTQKIDHSLYMIDAFLGKFPNADNMYSGGIDSTVMKFLVEMINPKCRSKFVNTTNEFSEILQHVKEVDNVDTILPSMTFIDTVTKFGFPITSKEAARKIHDLKYPTSKNQLTVNLYRTGLNRHGEYHVASKLSKKWFKLIDAPFDVTNKCCDILKKNPLKKISVNGVFIGTMAIDSNLRRKSYMESGCINEIKKVCKPLSIWKKDDVWSFVRERKLKYCSVYDKGEHNTGCAYCGMGCHLEKPGETRFDRLCHREPKRCHQMMNLTNNGVTFREALEFIGVRVFVK